MAKRIFLGFAQHRPLPFKYLFRSAHLNNGFENRDIAIGDCILGAVLLSARSALSGEGLNNGVPAAGNVRLNDGSSENGHWLLAAPIDQLLIRNKPASNSDK